METDVLIENLEVPRMDRRTFLKALGAISAGVALRAVPIVGETFSVLEPPRVYGSACTLPPGVLHGCGVHDDTDALQRMIDSMHGPDSLIFPQGRTFKLSRSLVVSGSLAINGNGGTLKFTGQPRPLGVIWQWQ